MRRACRNRHALRFLYPSDENRKIHFPGDFSTNFGLSARQKSFLHSIPNVSHHVEGAVGQHHGIITCFLQSQLYPVPNT